MERFEDHDELTETEASGGVKEHGVRYVLGISLFSGNCSAVDHVDHSGGEQQRLNHCHRRGFAAKALAMTDSNNLPPDRLSIHPFSEYFDQDALSRGIGIRFKGEQKTTVEEYCISEGWIKVPRARAVTARAIALMQADPQRTGRSLVRRSGRRRTGRQSLAFRENRDQLRDLIVDRIELIILRLAQTNDRQPMLRRNDNELAEMP
jgi:hypothetical protein